MGFVTCINYPQSYLKCLFFIQITLYFNIFNIAKTVLHSHFEIFWFTVFQCNLKYILVFLYMYEVSYTDFIRQTYEATLLNKKLTLFLFSFFYFSI